MVGALAALEKEECKDLVAVKHLAGTSKWGNCTAKEGVSKEALERIDWLLPGFFA